MSCGNTTKDSGLCTVRNRGIGAMRDTRVRGNVIAIMCTKHERQIFMLDLLKEIFDYQPMVATFFMW